MAISIRMPHMFAGPLTIRARFSLYLIAVSVFTSVALSAAYYVVEKHIDAEKLRGYLTSFAATAALQVDGDLHSRLTEPSQQSGADYHRIRDRLRAIMQANPKLHFIYTMRVNAAGQIIFVVDGSDPKDISNLGDVYDSAPAFLPAALRTIKAPFSDQAPYTDKWGEFMSAYAPIYRSDGSLEAVLGIDMTAEDVTASEDLLVYSTVAVLTASLLLALLLGRYMGRRLLAPVTNLKNAAEKIRSGNLGYRIEEAENDELGSVIQVFNDMTSKIQDTSLLLEEQVRARTAALEESEAKNRSILQTVADAIVTIDGQGIIESFNPAAEQIFGYARAEVIGRNVSLLMPEPYHSTHDDSLRNYLQFGTTHVLGRVREFNGRRKDGETFPIEISITRTNISNKVLFTGVIRDITERQRHDSELEAAKVDAEQANKAKSGFMSSMSHELRTPLNAIMGFAQLFEYAADLSEVHRDTARKIYSGGKHLLGLIDDIIDLGRVDSGHLALQIGPVSLPEVIESCHTLAVPVAGKYRVTLHFELSGCDDAWVSADPLRLKQVLLNLLSNAIKYNREQGAVHVYCSPAAAGRIRVNVRDTGNGISAQQQTQLFQPFNRMGKERSNIEGTGIGLVLTKRLVESMGGQLGLVSTVGEGTTFWVELPHCPPGAVRAAARPAAGAVAPLSRLSGTVLVAEDNLLNQQLISHQMNTLGCEAEIVANGKQALQAWQAGHYDVILTDCNMPEMDGYTLAAAIRDIERTQGGHVPIVAITANALSGEAERCLASGMDDYLAKPIDIQQLGSVLARWLSQASGAAPAAAVSAAPPAPPAETPVANAAEQLVDQATLQEFVGDDPATQRHFIELFLQTVRECIDGIHQGHSSDDSQQMASAAHQLKSAARLVGAAELAEICQALETACKEGIWQQIDGQIAALEGLLKPL
ncbi:MAG: PAS domain S-box protein [Gammaproteobacteria bacterium]|nr:PAS domain S-box protein [Gammaproteobacteria bacterium]